MGRRTGHGVPPAPRAGGPPPASFGAGGVSCGTGGSPEPFAVPAPANFGAGGVSCGVGESLGPSAVPAPANFGTGGALGGTGASSQPCAAPPLVDFGASPSGAPDGSVWRRRPAAQRARASFGLGTASGRRRSAPPESRQRQGHPKQALVPIVPGGTRQSAPLRRRAWPQQWHLRGRRAPLHRLALHRLWVRWVPSRAPGQRRVTARPRAAPGWRRFRPAAPEYHRSHRQPVGPLARPRVSCSAPAATMLPCCPHASGCDRRRAGRAAPEPRAPGAPPGLPTTCAGPRESADPSVGAVPARTPGRCLPSRCSGPAPPPAACRAAAPPGERRSPAGRRPRGWSCRRPARSARAGAAGSAARRRTPDRPTVRPSDRPETAAARARR